MLFRPLSKTTTTAAAFGAFIALLGMAKNANGFLMQSEGDNSLGFDIVRDGIADRVVMVGTTFDTTYSGNVGINGMTSMDCLVIVGHSSGGQIIGRLSLSSPQLCTVGAIVNHAANGLAVVAGTDGHKTLIQTIDTLATTPEVSQQYTLPDNNYPTELATSGDANVYIALHDTQDKAFLNTGEPNLKALMNFRDLVVKPQTASKVPPQILRMDAFDGSVSMDISLELESETIATVSGMIWTADALIVAGSTNGYGEAVGEFFGSNSPGPKADFDGYVTFLNPFTGEVQDNPIRIATNENDVLTGICLSGTKLYAVGTTDGSLEGKPSKDGGAFIVQIDTVSKLVKWRRQIYVATTKGMSCAAYDDAVFLGGTTKRQLNPNGNHEYHEHMRRLDHEHESKTQDVFVVAMSSSDLSVLWTKQLDTSLFFGDIDNRQDELVRIYPSQSGNINVLLNSHRVEKEANEIILLGIDKTTGFNELEQLAAVHKNSNDGLTDEQLREQRQRLTILGSILIPFFLVITIWGFVLNSRERERIRQARQAENHDLVLEERVVEKSTVV